MYIYIYIRKMDIYEIENYSAYIVKRIKHSFNNIDELTNEIKNNDKGYHSKILLNDLITFNIDLDGLKNNSNINISLEEFKRDIINYFSKHNIILTDNDIKYTENLNKVDKLNNKILSYHIAIPKLNCLSYNLKKILINIQNLYNYDSSLDSSQFGREGYGGIYRLPYQRKEKKEGTQHIIQLGEIKNFIVHYIELNSLNIDYIGESINNTIIKKNNKIITSKNVVINKIFDEAKFLSYKKDEKSSVIIDLLNILSLDRINDKKTWLALCYLMTNIKIDFQFEIFNELSKKSKYYETEEYIKYNYYKILSKTDKKINFGSLLYWAKLDNEARYNELYFQYEDIINLLCGGKDKNLNFNNVYGQLNNKTNIINKRFLICDNKTEIKNNTNIEDKEILKFVDDFINNENIKTLAIKSPYGSGKTDFLKSIFMQYTNRDTKILWVSFRKSLTNDLCANFEEFEFENYMDEGVKYNCNKLIVQLESLKKITNIDFVNKYDRPAKQTEIIYDSDEEEEEIPETTDEEYKKFVDESIRIKVPKYDIIIIDEIESVLNHFSSHTFKKQARNDFLLLEHLIKNSNKMICLDGDISNRSIDFINNFGESIIIENKYILNDRTLEFIENRDNFDKDIITNINNKKNVCIICMSSSEAEGRYNTYKNLYPDLTINLYTGHTGSDIKTAHLNNVNKIWNDTNILIYSPTIESGVNFDIEHFYKIYGVISCGSTSQRAFLQMTARCRKIEDKTILILNEISKKVNTADYWTYKQVLEGLYYGHTNILNNVTDKYIYNELTKLYEIKTELYLYDKISIYNKVEELNKSRTFFIPYLLQLAESKNYKIIYENSIDKMTRPIGDKSIKEGILLADDITFLQLTDLEKKQNKNMESREDKLKIQKYYLMNHLGIDKLDSDIMDIYYKHENNITNHINLIDSSNIGKYVKNEKIYTSNDFNYENEKFRCELINNLLNKLGFLNCRDYKHINHLNFDNSIQEIIKTNILFTNIEISRWIFNINKVNKIDIDINKLKQNKIINSEYEKLSNKAFLGMINTLLKNYCLEIKVNYINIKTGKKATNKKENKRKCRI